MRYNPAAPYNLLCNRDISFDDMQAVNRFARYWDMIANSGRFKHTLPLILGDAAFANFMQLSQSLYQRSGSTWKIALRRLYSLLFEILAALDRIDHEQLYQCLQRDYLRNGEKGDFDILLQATPAGQRSGVANRRQLRSMDN